MKINKYDRQIRIWGTKGQKKLSLSKIAVIGSSGSSIQAAKNLILPGVGRIDIFDDKVMSIQDLSNSFFFQNMSVGLLKGKQASKNLLEMNPDVQGTFYQLSIKRILEKPQNYLSQYDLIVCGNLIQQQNIQISKVCSKMNIPVIFITSVGFFFHVRSQKKIHIVESENISHRKYYMRLHDPFSGLQEYINKKSFSQLIAQLKMTDTNQEIALKLEEQISKIIYPVILVQAFRELKNEDGKSPKKQEIKNLLTEWKSLLGQKYRESINEAISRSFDLFQPADNFLPNIGILEDEDVVKADSQSQFVFIFLKAVSQFMKRNHNHLPQVVRLPDIHTTTKDYLEFKQIYKTQHEHHILAISNIIHEFCPNLQIDSQLISQYINNIDALQIVKIRPFYQELQNPNVLGTSLNYLNDQKNIFLALRIYKTFQNNHKRPPQCQDFDQCLNIAQQLCSKWQISNFDQNFIKQICRYQGQNLISYDSIAGAVAGQQGVKLITNCFTPMNNGYFYDGLKCQGYSLTL